MPTGEGLTEQARRYIELCRTEEIERLEQRIESERRVAELAKVEHKRLLKERSYKAPHSRHGRAAAAPMLSAITAAPPRTPEPAIANAAIGMFHFLYFFFVASKLLSWPSATSCNFFLLLRSSCRGLRPPPVLFFCCLEAPVVAFGHFL